MMYLTSIWLWMTHTLILEAGCCIPSVIIKVAQHLSKKENFLLKLNSSMSSKVVELVAKKKRQRRCTGIWSKLQDNNRSLFAENKHFMQPNPQSIGPSKSCQLLYTEMKLDDL